MACFIRLLKLNGQLSHNQISHQKRKIIKRKSQNQTSLKEKENKIMEFTFEGHSESSKKQFALEDKWLKNNFKTGEKYFYNRLFQ